jgi:glucokinase
MPKDSKIPLYFPDKRLYTEKKAIVLGGDAGGTKVNLSLFEASVDNLRAINSSTYHSSSFSSVNDIVMKFLKENPSNHPERICIGVAGPVFEGHVAVTNLPWHIDAKELSIVTGVSEVFLLNDLEATAYGVSGLEEKDLALIHPGDPDAGGNMAILSPGTGLGQAGLFWDGEEYHPFATEGGHCDYSPRNAMDMDLHDYMLRKFEVVSWESIIAGPAVYNIYQFLCDIKKYPVNDRLIEKFKSEDPSAVISETAIAGDDAVCIEAMRIFVRNLAHECCNLILKLKSTGGLFLAGGIPPKNISLLRDPYFYENLLDCDRMQDLVKKVPVRVILNDKAPVIGAGLYAAYSSTTHMSHHKINLP